MPTLESYNGYYLWHYVPSLIAAIIFEVLFVLATLFHAYKIARTKTWFCIVFVIGGIRTLPTPTFDLLPAIKTLD